MIIKGEPLTCRGRAWAGELKGEQAAREGMGETRETHKKGFGGAGSSLLRFYLENGLRPKPINAKPSRLSPGLCIEDCPGVMEARL